MIYALLFPLLSSVIIPQDITAVIDETSETVHREKIETRDVPHTVACNCVLTAKTRRPDIPLIDASMFVPSTTTPFIGAIAVMRYPSGAHHVAYVEGIGDGYVDLYHGNKEPCQITRERISFPNKRFQGFL